ncbi:hypothetical protein B0H11DRAFT_2341713 [Mycena galericulata]|nr:hypothetical protein B0H11DRAFT_2341713 [Mycena galericulata]
MAEMTRTESRRDGFEVKHEFSQRRQRSAHAAFLAFLRYLVGALSLALDGSLPEIWSDFWIATFWIATFALRGGRIGGGPPDKWRAYCSRISRVERPAFSRYLIRALRFFTRPARDTQTGACVAIDSLPSTSLSSANMARFSDAVGNQVLRYAYRASAAASSHSRGIWTRDYWGVQVVNAGEGACGIRFLPPLILRGTRTSSRRPSAGHFACASRGGPRAGGYGREVYVSLALATAEPARVPAAPRSNRAIAGIRAASVASTACGTHPEKPLRIVADASGVDAEARFTGMGIEYEMGTGPGRITGERGEGVAWAWAWYPISTNLPFGATRTSSRRLLSGLSSILDMTARAGGAGVIARLSAAARSMFTRAHRQFLGPSPSAVYGDGDRVGDGGGDGVRGPGRITGERGRREGRVRQVTDQRQDFSARRARRVDAFYRDFHRFSTLPREQATHGVVARLSAAARSMFTRAHRQFLGPSPSAVDGDGDRGGDGGGDGDWGSGRTSGECGRREGRVRQVTDQRPHLFSARRARRVDAFYRDFHRFSTLPREQATHGVVARLSAAARSMFTRAHRQFLARARARLTGMEIEVGMEAVMGIGDRDGRVVNVGGGRAVTCSPRDAHAESTLFSRLVTSRHYIRCEQVTHGVVARFGRDVEQDERGLSGMGIESEMEAGGTGTDKWRYNAPTGSVASMKRVLFQMGNVAQAALEELKKTDFALVGEWYVLPSFVEAIR